MLKRYWIWGAAAFYIYLAIALSTFVAKPLGRASPPPAPAVTKRIVLLSKCGHIYDCTQIVLNATPVTAPLLTVDNDIILEDMDGLISYGNDSNKVIQYGYETMSPSAPLLDSNGNVLITDPHYGLSVISSGGVLHPNTQICGYRGSPVHVGQYVAVPYEFTGGLQWYDSNYKVMPSGLDLYSLYNMQRKCYSSALVDYMGTEATEVWGGALLVNEEQSIVFYGSPARESWRIPNRQWPMLRATCTMDDCVLIADKFGEVIKVNRDGKTKWSARLGSAVLSPPIPVCGDLDCLTTARGLVLCSGDGKWKALDTAAVPRVEPCFLDNKHFLYVNGDSIISIDGDGRLVDRLPLSAGPITYGIFSPSPGVILCAVDNELYVIKRR